MYNPTDNEISLKVYNMHLYCDHVVYSFPHYIFLCSEDGPQWPEHVAVSIINKTQDSCAVTYCTPSLIAFRTVKTRENYGRFRQKC